MKKVYLFDWGNTIMTDFPGESGKMRTWKRVEAVEGAEAMLCEVSRRADCCLATNARDSDKEDIVSALRRVGLDHFFSEIFCFREIGFTKPSREYFQRVIDILGVEKEDAVMVGDSLENDVQGAEDFGIDAVLFDPQGSHPGYPGKRITRLTDLIREKD